jgi:NitT/TauT family transport system substrate-binding protein
MRSSIFKKFCNFFLISIFTIAIISVFNTNTLAKPKKYTVAWSIYAGWMPWDYAGHSGILKKWADKYGIKIDLVRMDYIPSVEAFVAKKVDACVMTNMECLDMPASSGVDCTILIMGDYSNGNDAILTRDGIGISDLPGNNICLVELSVSHYLLARCLDMNGLKESDVNLINTSDSDIGPVFLSNKSQKVVITWNPIVMEIEQAPGIRKIFTSADIPGEILDLMVVNTDVLKGNPDFGKALTGAWYEIMNIMSKRGPEADKALSFMAESAGASLVEYKKQLATTAMFYTPQSAVDYTKSNEIKEKMNFVRQFCYKHGLLGENAASADVVGIQYPDGTFQGDRKNIKMRFDVTYMQHAAEDKPAGKLTSK